MKHTTISSDVFAMCAVALFTTLSLVSCTPSTHHAETLPTAPPQTVTTTPSSPALSTDTDAPQNEPAAQAETSPSLLESWYERYRKPPYPLDGESREAIRDKKGRLECPDLEFETYRGTTLKYTKAIDAFERVSKDYPFKDIMVEANRHSGEILRKMTAFGNTPFPR
mgnify:CR=1 FL=1